MAERKHYAEILEGLKQCFPAPTSNPVMDAWRRASGRHYLGRRTPLNP
jgi:hypothetical protein